MERRRLLERETVIKDDGKRQFVKAAYESGGNKRMKKILGIILTVAGISTVIIGIILKVKTQMSVSIIGGADGPTAIFLAGKVGSIPVVTGIITGVGIVLLAVGIFMIIRKK